MLMKNEYDAVVIGGGPAGSGAATAAAKAGLSVLMIEKRAEIGSPKRCGEGLSKSAAERMGIKESDPAWVCQNIKGATVYAPNGKFARVDFPDSEGWVIERKIFDKNLARKAAEAGATVVSKTEAISLLKENDKIIGVRIKHQDEEMDVKAKIIIAADGVESKIAREAGINTTLKHEDIASAAQYEMANVDVDQDRLELYFGNEIAGGGYVWIFPKGGKNANVGIGVRKPFAKRKAIEYLNDFINSHENLKKGSIIEFNTGGVPVGAIMKNMVTDNFIVAGDAAHQVNPIHGGGISESYVGGRIAGEIAAEAIKKDNTSKEFLSKYNDIWWNERGEKLQKIEKLRKVVESLKDDDLNWLADHLKGEDLVELSKANKFKFLAEIMMKRPSLLLLARKLV